jgi:hypothetical protein
VDNFDLGLYLEGVDILKGPWDQAKFEDLLAKWIVATDQPFYTVDEPEFHKLLAYTHHPSPELKIPHHDAVRRQVMKTGEDSIEAMKEMFAVCESHPCLTGSLTSHYRRKLKARSAFHLMHGSQTIIMHLWQLWHIMS